jgi:hypothetical protein
LVDPVYITRTIDATPFPLAPNVCASFPHREDWWNRNEVLHTANSGRKRTRDDLRLLYENQKLDHQESVMKRLYTLNRWATGKAVFAEMRAKRDYSVNIFPFAFLPPMFPDSADALGTAISLIVPQTWQERALGIKPPGMTQRVTGPYWYNPNTPNAADVFYSDDRCKESDADGVLLHELVHATRYIRGILRKTAMRGGYPNSEEFYANIIEMIFRSERGQNVLDYEWHPTDQETVLKQPMARAFLAALCLEQMSLCKALAQVKANFNPIKPIVKTIHK